MQSPTLVTAVEYGKMPPMQQGYVHYMQAAWPGSELAELINPYPVSTPQHEEWLNGQQRAILEVMDMEA